MKKTLIFAGTGDTYLSVVYKPGEITHRDIKLQNTLYYAEIIETREHGFMVRFHIPFFKAYDRGGFISKQSALNYEQDILDAHFDEFAKGYPDELYETGIA